MAGRDGNGNFSLTNPDFVAGTTISSSQTDANNSDISVALTQSIAADGQTTTTSSIPFSSGLKSNTIAENTVGSGVTVDGVLLKDGKADTTKGTDIASATTTDIGAATGNYVDITGTTTITGLGTITAGAKRSVQFDGILTLTHSGTALILPGAANITTAAGDTAGFVSLGSGNWKCEWYTKASGAAVAGLVAADIGVTVQGYDVDTSKLDVAETRSASLNLADNELIRPKIKDYGETINAIGSIGGGTQDISIPLGNVVSGTVDTSTTTFTFSNPSATGTSCSFTLILTNGGSQTVNWPASVDWAGGNAPTLTTSGRDVLTFFTLDGGTIWYGFAAGLAMA